MRSAPILAVALVLAAASGGGAQRAPGRGHSILDSRGETVRVRLLNTSAKPLTDVPVDIWSDNGIRCFRAPCPTNGTGWKGRTDGAGLVAIPRHVLQASTSITVPGYEGDLVKEARQGPDGSWKMQMRATDAAQGQRIMRRSPAQPRVAPAPR